MWSASSTVTDGAVSVRPKPSWNGTPRSLKNSISGSGVGAPPDSAMSSDDRSWSSKPGSRISAAHIAGTRNCSVARCSAIAARKAGGSNVGTMTFLAPT